MAEIGASDVRVEEVEEEDGDYVIVDLTEEEYGRAVRYGGSGYSSGGRGKGKTKDERNKDEATTQNYYGDGEPTGSPSPTAAHGGWRGDSHGGDDDEECYDVSSVYHEPSWTEDGRRRLVHHVVYRPAGGSYHRGGKSDKSDKGGKGGDPRDSFGHRNDPG
ncbi:hypothetical protein THAOC_11422, partial [Thalassiosira oceanica]